MASLPETREQATEYIVWGAYKYVDEEPESSKILARFRFLQEAIDYAKYCVRRASRVVLTGPYGMASVYGPDTVLGKAAVA